MQGINVAVVGATGVVGKTILEILAERNFPIAKLYALASHRSAGTCILFKRKSVEVEDVATFDFSKVNVALFSAGSAVSEKYAPQAVAQGCTVIDNTSAFRYDDDKLLIVPEVNGTLLAQLQRPAIIANPNCSTIQMVTALKPIYDAVGITRINVATYQSVSGAGQKGITELVDQVGKMLNGLSIDTKVFQQQIAFNVIPHIDVFQDNGYTREEMKMVWETRKILNDQTIQVNPTAVRVPVLYGHSEAIHIETRDKITAKQATALLKKAPGVKVVDDPANNRYPTPLNSGSGTDPVYVGRIREDISHPRGLNLWVVADNVRKGAALNAVQIAECLYAPPSK